MSVVFKICLLISLFLFSAISFSQDLETVSKVDLQKYAGKWFEIASYPQRFQKGCQCTTAEYTLTTKDYLIVENRCNKDSLNGNVSYIKGKVFAVKNTGNSKLKVQFFWPFKGKYWIIDLAPDYSYAVVGHPNRNYLWILSRTATIDDVVYEQIVSRIASKGYDISKIVKTKQK
jgi:apolipoprotein D and lipocalin family protein